MILLLNQNRKAACGQHKEEIISQLRDLAKLEPNLSLGDVDTEGLSSMHPLVPEQYLQLGNLSTGFEHDFEADIFPSCQVKTLFFWYLFPVICSFITIFLNLYYVYSCIFLMNDLSLYICIF